jgi:hypothetical protein
MHQALGVGGMAEFGVHVEQMIQPVAADMIKIAMALSNAEDVVTRRNAVYCLGVALQ